MKVFQAPGFKNSVVASENVGSLNSRLPKHLFSKRKWRCSKLQASDTLVLLWKMSVFQTLGFKNKGFHSENVGFPSSRLQTHWLVFGKWRFSTLQASKTLAPLPSCPGIGVSMWVQSFGFVCISGGLLSLQSIRPKLSISWSVRWRRFLFYPAWRNANEKDFMSGWPGALQMKNISVLFILAQCKWNRFHFWLAWRSANEKHFIVGQPGAVQMKKISFLSGLAQCEWNIFHFYPAWRSADETYFIAGWPGAVHMKNISFLSSLTQCIWKIFHLHPGWRSAITKYFMSCRLGTLQMKQISFLSSLAQCSRQILLF